MSVSIRINSLSFETPVTTEFANPLTNSGQSVQSLDETILTFSAVRVTAISLEIPVSTVSAESITNSGQGVQSIDETIVSPVQDTLDTSSTSVHSIDEVILGTQPAVQPAGSVPGNWVGAGAAVRYAQIRTKARSEQAIDEEIFVREDFVTVATSTQTIETFIREERVIHDNRVLRDTPAQPVTIAPRVPVKLSSVDLVSDIPTMSKEKLRQKEEDELVLLGILG